VSRSDWIADRLGAAYVHGWVVTGSGDDLPEALLTYRSEPSLPALEPGGRVSLRVELRGMGVGDLPRGEYRLHAVVAALDLWAAPGGLHLT